MVSKRMLEVAPSATGVMAARVSEMRDNGIEVLSFNLGEPDFDTPKAIIDAGIKAMQTGQTRYTTISGILPLRKAIAEKLELENAVHYEPSQICVSTGAKQALLNAFFAVVNPGDEVLIPTPCWVSYVEMTKLAGGTPVMVDPGKDYQLNMEAIRAAITAKTKMIVINTPNNPTGACYPKEDLLELGRLAVEHDFYILSDEVYEKLIYGKEHVCVASLSEEIYEHTITINAFSKAYAMTGWRLGYSAAPADVAKAIVTMQSNSTTCATAFVQEAAITALKCCADDVETMRIEFEKRRDYAYERINAMEGVSCTKPDGAFYLMPDVTSFYGKSDGKRTIESAMDICEYILEEAKAAVVPGDAFCMPGTFRIAYATSMELIEEGMNRIEAALAKLS